MSITASDERKFKIFRRGEIRDNVILRSWRNSLRALINPETGVAFTEDEISIATQRGSRFYIEADAIDILGQVMQSRSLHLANQLRPNRSNGQFLEDFHSNLWLGPDAKLPATGGSGYADAPATVGSIFVGSTTIGDPAATVATDPTGKRYQVLTTVVTPAGGVASLELQAVDVGSDTNPSSGTILTWVYNQPPGAETEAVVTDPLSIGGFSGGFDTESDADLGERIESRMRHKPACGNNAHWEAWARAASVAIESAFIYPIAFNAGSTMVCVLQKRSSSETALEGPLIRSNVAPGTMASVASYLTPPGSPVVPHNVYAAVVKANPQYADLVLRISMALGSDGGWKDTTPWPNPSDTSGYPDVKVASSPAPTQTQFNVVSDSSPSGTSPLTGDNVPSLMMWNRAKSRFEELDVQSVSWVGNIKTIVLNGSGPSFTIQAGDRLSPMTSRMDVIAVALESYFDSLGPGQVIDLNTDPRAARGYRYPTTSEQYPSRAGQAVSSNIIDALGGLAPDIQLDSISRNEPDVPSEIIDGPNLVVLGHVNIYPFAV